jgi:hypothetical protein
MKRARLAARWKAAQSLVVEELAWLVQSFFTARATDHVLTVVAAVQAVNGVVGSLAPGNRCRTLTEVGARG